MSVRWITWAWEQDCSNAAEKLTLIALADHAGEDGKAFPGCARLAEKTGSGERTVRRHLDQLEETGKLTRERRRRADGSLGTYTYQLVDEPAANLASGQDDQALPATVAGRPAATRGRAEPSCLNRQEEPSVTTREVDFEIFWETYGKVGPRKVAHDCWAKAIKRGATAIQLQVALVAWKDYWSKPGAASMKWPQGWLNNDYWAGDPPPVRGESVEGWLEQQSPGRQAILRQRAARNGVTVEDLVKEMQNAH